MDGLSYGAYLPELVERIKDDPPVAQKVLLEILKHHEKGRRVAFDYAWLDLGKSEVFEGLEEAKRLGRIQHYQLDADGGVVVL